MTTYVGHWSDDRLSAEAVSKIANLCTTGEARRYGQIDADRARVLADAAVLVGATTSEQIYRLYTIDRTYCVEHKLYPSTVSEPPCRSYTRPHYGQLDWGSRTLSASEISEIYTSD